MASAPRPEVDLPWIIENMVGCKQEKNMQRNNECVREEQILSVKSLFLPRVDNSFLLEDVTFSLKAGEILGIYGLRGAGRTELLECLFGVHPEAYGEILINKQRVDNNDIQGRIKAGLILIPEDRQKGGICQNLSVKQNMSLASLGKYSALFHLQEKKEALDVDQQIKNMSVKVRHMNSIITSLSGGNQQKVIIGKGLLTVPHILLLDEPTRGIDVNAKKEIFQIIQNLASQGMGIVFVASELKEIMAISDRILVLSKGKLTGEFSKAEATEEALVVASAVGHEIKRT
jgi:erythritol transport system ATP-binding protein